MTDSHVNQYLRRNDNLLAGLNTLYSIGEIGGIAVHCICEKNDLICRYLTLIGEGNRERCCNEARYQTLLVIEEDDKLGRSVLVLQEEILRARGVIVHELKPIVVIDWVKVGIRSRTYRVNPYSGIGLESISRASRISRTHGEHISNIHRSAEVNITLGILTRDNVDVVLARLTRPSVLIGTVELSSLLNVETLGAIATIEEHLHEGSSLVTSGDDGNDGIALSTTTDRGGLGGAVRSDHNVAVLGGRGGRGRTRRRVGRRGRRWVGCGRRGGSRCGRRGRTGRRRGSRTGRRRRGRGRSRDSEHVHVGVHASITERRSSADLGAHRDLLVGTEIGRTNLRNADREIKVVDRTNHSRVTDLLPKKSKKTPLASRRCESTSKFSHFHASRTGVVNAVAVGKVLDANFGSCNLVAIGSGCVLAFNLDRDITRCLWNDDIFVGCLTSITIGRISFNVNGRGVLLACTKVGGFILTNGDGRVIGTDLSLTIEQRGQITSVAVPVPNKLSNVHARATDVGNDVAVTEWLNAVGWCLRLGSILAVISLRIGTKDFDSSCAVGLGHNDVLIHSHARVAVGRICLDRSLNGIGTSIANINIVKSFHNHNRIIARADLAVAWRNKPNQVVLLGGGLTVSIGDGVNSDELVDGHTSGSSGLDEVRVLHGDKTVLGIFRFRNFIAGNIGLWVDTNNGGLSFTGRLGLDHVHIGSLTGVSIRGVGLNLSSGSVLQTGALVRLHLLNDGKSLTGADLSIGNGDLGKKVDNKGRWSWALHGEGGSPGVERHTSRANILNGVGVEEGLNAVFGVDWLGTLLTFDAIGVDASDVHLGLTGDLGSEHVHGGILTELGRRSHGSGNDVGGGLELGTLAYVDGLGLGNAFFISRTEEGGLEEREVGSLSIALSSKFGDALIDTSRVGNAVVVHDVDHAVLWLFRHWLGNVLTFDTIGIFARQGNLCYHCRCVVRKEGK